MYWEFIDDVFRNRKGNLIGNYKKSAIMLLIYEQNGEEYIIFEQRAFELKSQPGDICFPGGKIEQNETPLETAVRETSEELGILKENIEILGEMDYFISPYGLIMYPFVGRLLSGDIVPNKSEVQRVIMIPLEFFLNSTPQVHEINIVPEIKENFPFHLIYGGKKYKFSKGKMSQYFYSYEGYNIWGFTALITKRFVDILLESKQGLKNQK